MTEAEAEQFTVWALKGDREIFVANCANLATAREIALDRSRAKQQAALIKAEGGAIVQRTELVPADTATGGEWLLGEWEASPADLARFEGRPVPPAITAHPWPQLAGLAQGVTETTAIVLETQRFVVARIHLVTLPARQAGVDPELAGECLKLDIVSAAMAAPRLFLELAAFVDAVQAAGDAGDIALTGTGEGVRHSLRVAQETLVEVTAASAKAQAELCRNLGTGR
jgi:hypothetical protein